MPLFIYANHIEHNIKVIQEKTNKKIMAVVKSNAYEMKTSFMIPLLRKNGVNFFVFEKWVEYLNAKEDLTKNDDVLIMESLNKEMLLQIKNEKVRVTVNSPIDVLYLKDISNKITVHLRIDTGMNRLGIRSIDEYKWILRTLQENEKINIEGIYTHFSTEPSESNYFEKQINLFEKYLKIRNFPIIHANATKSLNKRIVGNYVRVGMALYGYSQPYLSLKPVVQIIERPCSVFYPKNNKKIGYSKKYVKKKVGVLGIGYHDVDLVGIKTIFLKKQKVPLLGKSCMNHTHFLASDKINYLSWLSIFPTNGIIYNSNEYNWYHILTSLKNMPRGYLRRRNYDIPKVCKISWEKSNPKWYGTRSNQDSGLRIITNGRCYFFRPFKRRDSK